MVQQLELEHDPEVVSMVFSIVGKDGQKGFAIISVTKELLLCGDAHLFEVMMEDVRKIEAKGNG